MLFKMSIDTLFTLSNHQDDDLIDRVIILMIAYYKERQFYVSTSKFSLFPSDYGPLNSSKQIITLHHSLVTQITSFEALELLR
jgi:hypothetical protein